MITYPNPKKSLFTLLAAYAIAFGLSAQASDTTPSLSNTKILRWDWKQLEERGSLKCDHLTFPQGFIFGAGSSAQQVEGGTTNNDWSEWEEFHLKAQTKKKDGSLLIESLAGDACNQQDAKQLAHDIELLNTTGLNGYRFSLEWSKIEPQQGQFNEDALDYYENLCQQLVARGIRPAITMIHYTLPRWFAKLGGFETSDNIPRFVRFCEKVFDRLNKYNPLWLTFNSPSSYAIQSYMQGERPAASFGTTPTKNMQLAMEVLHNVLQAHVYAYHAMKQVAKNNDEPSEIGILHNVFHLDPFNKYNPLDILAAAMGRKISHDTVYNFFATGSFYIWIPGKAYVNGDFNPEAQTSLDFIGLNYYSHGLMKNFKPVADARDEYVSDNPRYTVYAEGLYRAIEELYNKICIPVQKASGNKELPIYVTENGISTSNEETRKIFYQRTMHALSYAAERFPVRGYFNWCFIDNAEWGSARGSKRYGIYHNNFETQERTLKPGAQHYLDVAKFHCTKKVPATATSVEHKQETKAGAHITSGLSLA